MLDGWGRHRWLLELLGIAGESRLRSSVVLLLRDRWHWRGKLGWWWWSVSCSLRIGCLHDASKHGRVNQTQKKKGLKDGVGELRGLAEEFGRLGWVGHGKALHLRDDIEQLRRGQGAQRLGNCVRARQSRGDVGSRWQNGEQ